MYTSLLRRTLDISRLRSPGGHSQVTVRGRLGVTVEKANGNRANLEDELLPLLDDAEPVPLSGGVRQGVAASCIDPASQRPVVVACERVVKRQRSMTSFAQQPFQKLEARKRRNSSTSCWYGR